MAQIRLKNSSGRYSVIGQQVKLAPNSKTSFVVAELGDFGIIGTVAESVPNTYSCVINLINTVTWADVLDSPITDGHASGSDNQDLSGLVPYTGSTSDIDLGIHNLTADTNSLFVDSVNHRVGIRTTAPLAKLNVYGDAKIGVSNNATVKTLDIAGHTNFDSVIVPVDTSMTATLAGAGAGNVDNGQHYYAISYVTADGMTGAYTPTRNVTVVDKTTDGKVSLANIPVSADPRVTGRRIYRNISGQSQYYTYYLGLINDNTTTTYTDNTADSSLVLTDYIYRKANTTAGRIYMKSVLMMQATDDYHTSLGINALASNTLGNSIVAIGGSALTANTLGNNNTALGYNSLSANTTGSSNNAVGYASMSGSLTGSSNNAFGDGALRNNSSYNYSYNSAFGTAALSMLATNNSYNIGIGYQAGLGFQGTNNIHMGTNTGNVTPGTMGNYNIFIGDDVGDNAASGADGNILIGKQLDLPVTNGDNQLSIGNLIFATGMDGTGTTISSGKVGIGTNGPLSKLSINGGLHVGGDSDAGDNNILADGTITGSNLSNTNTGDQTSASLLSSSLALTGRVADIADTNFTVNTAGFYRIGFYLVDTIADITAGAVTLHIKYTDSGGARDIASSPVVLSALTGFAQGEVIVQLASGTTTYGVTHSGIFGTATYALFLTQERLQ